MKKGNHIPIGKIIKLSGHSGELIISGPSISDKLKPKSGPVFIELDLENVPFYIENITPINKDKAVVSFEYVKSERKAQKLIQKELLVLSAAKKKADMDKNIIGYKVEDEAFGVIGNLISVDENIKNPLMIIENGSNQIFVPFQTEFISGVDHKKKVLFVKCPEGLLDLYINLDEEE